MNEELNIRISELLGCSSRTSESILKTLDKYSDGGITEIDKENRKTRIRIRFKDSEGKLYIAIMGRGYVVEEIYRDNEEGERIYRAIQ